MKSAKLFEYLGGLHLDSTKSTVRAPADVLMLHGFLATHKVFQSFGKLLNAHRVHIIDLPNHGRSEWTEDADFRTMATAVHEHMQHEATKGRKYFIIGHSWGGKVGMAMSLQYPENILGLVVMDIAPLNYKNRLHADKYGFNVKNYTQIVSELQSTETTTKEELDSEIQKAVPSTTVQMMLSQTVLRNPQTNKFRISMNGRLLYENFDAVCDFPFKPTEEVYEGPALLLKGGKSPWVPPDGLDRAKDFFPKLQIEEIEGAGHIIHAQKPHQVAAYINTFFEENSVD
eukprot:Filipodium_phascolosomae@DN7965_c0_g1_i1.p1